VNGGRAPTATEKPTGAHDEVLLAATAQNLRKLAKLVPLSDLNPASDQGGAIAPMPWRYVRPIYCALSTDFFNRIDSEQT